MVHVFYTSVSVYRVRVARNIMSVWNRLLTLVIHTILQLCTIFACAACLSSQHNCHAIQFKRMACYCECVCVVCSCNTTIRLLRSGWSRYCQHVVVNRYYVKVVRFVVEGERVCAWWIFVWMHACAPVELSSTYDETLFKYNRTECNALVHFCTAMLLEIFEAFYSASIINSKIISIKF